MLITTADVLQGIEIAEYKGVVAARVANAKQAKAEPTVVNLCDIISKNAKDIGADAVIGLRVIPETMTIFATGTAVKLK